MQHNHDDQPFCRADEQAATSGLSTTARSCGPHASGVAIALVFPRSGRLGGAGVTGAIGRLDGRGEGA